MPVTIYPETYVTDSRGNKQKAPDRGNPIHTFGAAIPQRSSKAEVPGQAEVDVYRLILPETVGLGLWSFVEWRGRTWDVAAPPAYHHGTRHTRHISVDIRRRPGG